MAGDKEDTKFIPIPGDHDEAVAMPVSKKRQNPQTCKMGICLALGLLLAWMTWITIKTQVHEEKSQLQLQQLLQLQHGFLQPENNSDVIYRDNRDNRQITAPGLEGQSTDGQTCSELGAQLEFFDSTLFHHIARMPQCGHEIKPKLTLFTRTQNTSGCVLTESPSSGTHYDISRQCQGAIINLNKIVFIVHGFALFPEQLEEFLDMKTEILKLDDAGVIVVDWYKGARLDLSFLKISNPTTIMRDFVNLDFYHQAAANTRYIGAALALVAENLRTLFLQQSRTPFMHCIGHSLGSHVCGFFGKALKRISGAPLDRITGLDPAGPLFLESGITTGLNSYSDDSHLCAADATLVDTIHTDSTWLGSFTKTGDLDFYVGESKTNEDSTEKVDKFGYDQPGVEDCFMESHHRAIDIFAATIQDNTCTAEKLCNNIHLNATNGCHPAENIQFGYKIEQHGQSLRGSVPINSDIDSINCSQGARINIHGHPTARLMKEVSKMIGMMTGLDISKMDFCSLLRTILGPIDALLRAIEYIHKKSQERILKTKHAVRLELDRLLNSPEGLAASQVEVIAILEDIEELEILQEDEMNSLRNLATRTKRVSGDIVSDLNEIKANGAENVEIEDIVIQIRDLLNYSTEKLDTVEKKLEEISRRWGRINIELSTLKRKVTEKENEAEKLLVQLNNRKNLTEAEKGKFKDWAVAVTGIVVSVAAIGGTVAVASFGLPVDPTAVYTALGGVGVGGVIGTYSEVVEWWEEEENIETFKEAIREVKNLLPPLEKFGDEIAEAKTKVKDKKEEIKARKKILKDWTEIVDGIIIKYGRNDYKKLEYYLLRRNTYQLNKLLKDFKALEDVAEKFLNSLNP